MYIINVSNVSNNESPISLLILATMCAGFPFPVNYRCVQVESSGVIKRRQYRVAECGRWRIEQKRRQGLLLR